MRVDREEERGLGKEEVRFAAWIAAHLTVSLAWSVLQSSLLQYGGRQILITLMHYGLTATFGLL